MGCQLKVRTIFALRESRAERTESRVPMRARVGMSMTTSSEAPVAIASWRDLEAVRERAESAERSVWRAASWAAESGCGAAAALAACGEGVAREGGAECEQAASVAARAAMVSGRILENGCIPSRSATAP